MTSRERLVRTLTFGQPDRVYYSFGNPRQSTLDAWRLQGLRGIPDIGAYGCPDEFRTFVGMDVNPWQRRLPIEMGIFPAFEPRIIEENESGRIWMDEMGIVMHDAGDALNTPGFRTRTYISHPVQTREDWPRMRERYDPRSPGRYPDDWPAHVDRLRNHDYPVTVIINGLFWKARDWVGFERLCMLFYDDPAFVHEMMEHVTVFTMDVLDRATRDVEVDAILLNEDMAYKSAAMISPPMFREFMLPRYKRLVAFAKSRGIQIVAVDSDGHIGQLLPLWIEAGVTAGSPVEIAAHNDPIAYRQKYGKSIAFWGAIDKREIRGRERTFVEVMRKVPWLIEQGGYMPGVDHGVPPDVPLRSYLYMCELIKAIAEGRPVPGPDVKLEIEETLGPIRRMWSPDMTPGHDDDES